jgi:aminoglycoside phosphotransferase (APT) family kinase protein
MLESRSEPPAALALEYVQGVNLGSLIRRGLKKSLNPSPPFSAATAVARCLAHIHSVSTPRIGITSSCEETYPDKIIETLGGLTGGKVRPLALLLRSARERLSLSSDRLVHGDANPTNFIVEPSGTAVAIDLERLGRGDPHLDIGFLLADFIHMASHCGQPKAAAELAEAFRAAYKPPIDSARERYFTALGLLRIARNPWHTPFHRDWLIARAERLLSA